MNKYLKLSIAVFSAILLANIVTTSFYSFIYRSETEKAIERSNKHIEDIKKRQQEFLQQNASNQHKAFNEQYKSSLLRSNNNLEWHSRKNNYNYQRDLEDKRRKKIAEKRRLEREKERKYEREKVRLLNEKYRIQQANKQADREHIRKENIKTCEFWTKKYKDKPTAKHESLRQSSCKRAYG